MWEDCGCEEDEREGEECVEVEEGGEMVRRDAEGFGSGGVWGGGVETC